MKDLLNRTAVAEYLFELAKNQLGGRNLIGSESEHAVVTDLFPRYLQIPAAEQMQMAEASSSPRSPKKHRARRASPKARKSASLEK